MKVKFYKMQSFGNDYIYFDLFACKQNYRQTKYVSVNAPTISQEICARRFSLGGDGIVLITPSAHADVRMIIYNSDGSRAKMCGNALRAVGYYVCGRLKSHAITVETDSGLRRVYVTHKSVMAEMGRAKFYNRDVVNAYDKDLVRLLNNSLCYDFVNVGNPHLSLFVKDIKSFDFGHIAPLLSKNAMFEGGVNVEIATLNGGKINARVYERGSGETLSCGTGACAIAASAFYNGLINSGKTKVSFIGGSLFIEINKDFSLILGGEVKMVCEGVIDI